MNVSDLMRVRLIDGPADGRTMMTPDTNTSIRFSFEIPDAYEIHKYDRVEDTDVFLWVGHIQ